MRKKCSAVLFVSLAILLAGCSGKKDAMTEKTPVYITIWNYYNGEQKEAFDALVNEFNTTIGEEKGIVVESHGQGSVTDLEANVMAAIRGDVGADEVPDIFSAYADTAYSADLMGAVVNLREYLTDEEIASYVEGYIEEGDFSGNGELKIFPIAKSTEVLVVNKTAWTRFSEETGAAYQDMATVEGLTETAKLYYEWTDAQTPEIAEDGKALYGRDAMANYMLIGAMQLGTELFCVENGRMTLHFEEETVKKLWDCYYVPFIKGYFASSGRFRSDDMKTGNVIAYTGSCSSASYYPHTVSISDTESYQIEVEILPAPQFEGTEGYAVQQGAGMVVTKGTEREIAASIAFLKWFTEKGRNIQFAVESGYLPVKKAANEKGAILDSGYEISEDMKHTLSVAIDTVNDNYMYTTKAFEQGAEARTFLENMMSERAVADRAVVAERLAAGMTLEEASEEFCSEEYFKMWYEKEKAELEKWETK